MATQTESTKFVLEGDQEYKEKLESINQQYGKLYQQLTKLKTETENTAKDCDCNKNPGNEIYIPRRCVIW